MGENLTTAGIDPNEALIGERWSVGSTVLEVSEPRSPCYRLGLRHGDPTLPIQRARKGGVYRTVFNTGQVRAIIEAQDWVRDRIAVNVAGRFSIEPQNRPHRCADFFQQRVQLGIIAQ